MVRVVQAETVDLLVTQETLGTLETLERLGLAAQADLVERVETQATLEIPELLVEVAAAEVEEAVALQVHLELPVKVSPQIRLLLIQEPQETLAQRAEDLAVTAVLE